MAYLCHERHSFYRVDDQTNALPWSVGDTMVAQMERVVGKMNRYPEPARQATNITMVCLAIPNMQYSAMMDMMPSSISISRRQPLFVHSRVKSVATVPWRMRSKAWDRDTRCRCQQCHKYGFSSTDNMNCNY